MPKVKLFKEFFKYLQTGWAQSYLIENMEKKNIGVSVYHIEKHNTKFLIALSDLCNFVMRITYDVLIQ